VGERERDLDLKFDRLAVHVAVEDATGESLVWHAQLFGGLLEFDDGGWLQPKIDVFGLQDLRGESGSTLEFSSFGYWIWDWLPFSTID
jgi:hypothetical protein